MKYWKITYQIKGTVKYLDVHAETKQEAKEKSGIEICLIIRVEEI